MMAHTRLFTSACLLVAFGLSPVAARQTAVPSVAGVAKTTRPSVVTIKTPSGTGSGVVVDPSGVIVTNLHVVRGDNAATIVLSNGDSYDDVSVIDVDERRDIVLLKIKAFGVTAAKIGNSDRVRVGDRVVLVSSPLGLELTVSEGVVSAQRDSGEGYRMLQTTAAASPGSSGGGLFNMAGELVGIMSTKRMDGENLNFALPFNYVRGLIATTARMTLGDLAAKYPASGPASGTEETATGNTQTQDLAKIARLLEQTGEKIVKESDKSWSAAFEGDHSTSIKVFITAGNGIALISSVVDTKPPTDMATLVALMRLSFDTDFAKVGLDKDQTLFALTEADVAQLDAPTLKKLIRGVATLTDKTVGVLVSGPSATSLTYLEGRMTIEFGGTTWKRSDGTDDYDLTDERGDAYIKVIAERPEIPTDKIADMALDNARKRDPRLKVIRRAARTVNGVRMTTLEFEAVIDQIAMTFYGHYYGGPEGTIQIIAWTSRNLAKEYRPQFEKLVDRFNVRR